MNYEEQYYNMVKRIMKEGVEELNERTGLKTKRIPHATITVDLQKEFPIIKAKKTHWKSAIKEILWIMQSQSNNINDLDSHIWDEWADENGSIGKAYGYQIKQHKQIDKILELLKTDKSNRRMVIDLWQLVDIDEMNLTPCCYSSIFTVIDNKLNCMLIQRSSDTMLGNPFNTTQYAALTCMLAHCSGLEVGTLTHCIADAHIYENQYNGVMEYLKQYTNMTSGNIRKDKEYQETIRKIATSTPKLDLSEAPTDFYKITIDDFKVTGYESMPFIKFPVAV